MSRDYSGYSRATRTIESAVLIAYVILEAVALYRTATLANADNLWLIAIGAAAGFLGADFVSGFLHWAADTWGSVNWPIIGSTLVRTFREHHVDPLAITRHDFVETNGAVCMMALPFLIAAAAMEITQPWHMLALSFFAFQCLWGSLTNQIHKWSHQTATPRFVVALQKSGLILSRKAHNRHHASPFITNYCINSGILNAPLEKLRFFQTLEWIIHRVTGAIPRDEDLGRERALQIAAARGAISLVQDVEKTNGESLSV